MKECECYGCGKVIEIFDEYEPVYCCSGYCCGCMGKAINPIFCDECVSKLFGDPNLGVAYED